MKKLIFIILLFPSLCFAAGSATMTKVHYSRGHKVIKVEIEAGNNGSFTSWEIQDSDGVSYNFNGYIAQADTTPGATAPTANYDITLQNGNSYDVFNTALSNRSAASPQVVRPLINGNDTGIFNYGPLTLGLTGNSQTGALVTLEIHLATFD